MSDQEAKAIEQEQPEGEQKEALTRYCRRCHRRLKSEASMKIGYGPICLKKVAA